MKIALRTALFEQFLPILVPLLGFFILLGGCSVIGGWIFDNRHLTSILPRWESMKVNSAICFILTGLAIILSSYNLDKPKIKRSILCLSFALICISGLTLLEYLFHLNFSIDELFFKDNDTSHVVYPGRMTINTALLFFLTAWSFVLIIKKNANPWLFQTLLWFVFSSALFCIINYTYGSNLDSYLIAKLTIMALNTALLFILSSIGMLLIKKDTGIMSIILSNTYNGWALRRILPFIILIPLLVTHFVNYGLKLNLYSKNYSQSIEIVGTFAILSTIIAIIANIIHKQQQKLSISEEQLEETQNIFREFAEKFDGVLYRANIGIDHLYYVSPAYEKIWGEPVESLYKNPKQFFEFIIPEDKKLVEELFFNKISSSSSIELHYRIKRRDGTIRYIYDKTYQVKDKEGIPKYIIGIALDITESLYLKKLSQNEKHIAQVLDHENSIYTAAPKILRMICNMNSWDCCELWLVDEQTQVLRCVTTYSASKTAQPHFYHKSKDYTFNYGEGLPGMAWETRKLINSADYEQSYQILSEHITKQTGLNNTLAVPIMVRDKVYGVINCFSTNPIIIDEVLKSFLENIGKLLGHFIYFKYTEEQIDKLSRFDLLTGLMNQSAFEGELDALIRRNQPQFAVLILDIQRFALINNVQGHHKGNLLLQLIAKRLQKLNKRNPIARVGVDKFILYSDNHKPNNDIEIFVQTLNNSFKEPFFINTEAITLCIHIGVALYPNDGKNAKTLIDNAEFALAASKASTENKVCYFNNSMAVFASKKLQLEKDLQRALEEEQLILYYQPQIDLKSGSIIGAEALIRWQHPEKGLLPPGTFLPYAEEMGFMVSINEYVLRTVFKTIGSQWMGPPISVNISSEQFTNQYTLLEYLEQLITEYKVDPEHVLLEVTENMLMQNNQHTLTVIAALQQMGFQISLDDFGTGFSSFSYLQHFTVDQIKIDKSFILDLPEKSKNVLIVRSIIQLFHSMQAQIVAEGVETKEAMEFLKKEGCDIAQGYYYYKPMPFQEFLALINLTGS